MSRYHIARRTDGDGWILFVLDALGSSKATVIGPRMTEKAARKRLAEFRSTEGIQS